MRETKIGLIQSPLQADLDRIADGVMEYLDTDMAFFSVAHNSSVFSLGVSTSVQRVRSGRTHAPEDTICAQVMDKRSCLALSDARDDPEFSNVRYVREGMIVGYLGVTVQNAEIGPIGTLCAVSKSPREWSDADVQYIQTIAESIENLILREMYRLESLDATTLASEYDQIIAAFALVRAEPTSIHDRTGRLVFANRTLTDLIDETELEGQRFKSVLLTATGDGPIRFRSAAGDDYVLTRLRTGSGYIVSQWKPATLRLN